MIDTEKFRELARAKDWQSIEAMLEDARQAAESPEDVRSEVHWRIAAYELQQRYQEALDLLRSRSAVYVSQSYVKHRSAQILGRLGRANDALLEMQSAPLDQEMRSFYGLAMDAKFYYFHLMAEAGDPSVANRLREVPDDFVYLTRDGASLTKQNIIAKLTK